LVCKVGVGAGAGAGVGVGAGAGTGAGVGEIVSTAIFAAGMAGGAVAAATTGLGSVVMAAAGCCDKDAATEGLLVGAGCSATGWGFDSTEVTGGVVSGSGAVTTLLEKRRKIKKME
jgi:hypothetical protein